MYRHGGSGPAEHAGEATTVEGNGAEDLAAFGDTCAALMRHVGVPGGAVSVEADTVWSVLAEIGPDPATRQSSVGDDVEADEVVSVGVGNHKSPIVRRDGHAIGEGDVLGDQACRARQG